MVKKGLYLLLACLLLTGCAARETMETVSDEWAEEAQATVREILVELPQEAAAPAAENADGRIYVCSDYEIEIRTMEGGDLERTIRSLSGYGKEDLTVISSGGQDMKRYDFVWAAAGEEGDRVGRAVILDDGNYHYTMTVLRDADMVENSQIVWRTVFESFTLA